MARKKRIPEETAPAAAAEPKERVQYQDAFQTTVTHRIEDVGKQLEGKGRTILYGLAAAAVLLALIGIFYLWNRSSNQKAQAAFGKAIETHQAVVTDSPVPVGTTIKTFKTEKERAEAAIAEFQSVADRFGGDIGDKAKYFVAVNRLALDRAAGVTELQGLAGRSGEVGKLAKFALAQAHAGEGKLDEAARIYQELVADSNPVMAKETLQFELAKTYEKQGKKDEAVNLYFEIAKAAAEAKDLDGKPVSPTTTATEAKAKVQELDPEKAKQLPEPPRDEAAGTLPISLQ